jgi:hypothetical protein
MGSCLVPDGLVEWEGVREKAIRAATYNASVTYVDDVAREK